MADAPDSAVVDSHILERSLSSGVPSIRCPMPAPLIIPVAALGIPSVLVIFIPSVLFLVWSRSQHPDLSSSSRRARIAFILIAIASATWFGWGWHYGVKYQGYDYMRTTALINAVFSAIIAGVVITRRRTGARPVEHLILDFLLFAWTFTYAFPYFGELP
jgi:hypothetical protein